MTRPRGLAAARSVSEHSRRGGERQDPFSELARYSKLFYDRGWMPGTSGNLSIKIKSKPLTIAITPSSVDKGEVAAGDILVVSISKVVRGKKGLRPSAETSIHEALYESFPDCGAVFHVHTVHSTLVATRCASKGVVAFAGLEMLKGFETLSPKAPAKIPVLDNIDDLKEFGENVRRNKERLSKVPAFLIAHHGMTCWGKNGQEAEKNLELMEFLCRYAWEAQ
ncbi:MAG: methylthioribulose 1-phosphate dehydratase [Candidatus Omnitrophica bacterium]|nr:methylthioribulose 1-phosphate dehydratase [Candidatus Omnitrophota bacterium]